MATEFIAPDTLISSSGFTGTPAVTDIDERPASYDANWFVASGNNTNTDAYVSFGTPTGSPTVGADLQSFVAAVREYDTGQSGTPTCRLELWENGTIVRAGSDIDVTSQGQQITFTWNASELGTADGSLVECKIINTKTGGAPSSRNTVDIGAVEWQVTYTAAAPSNSFEPDALLAKSSHFTGSLSDIDDPVTDPGTDWMTGNSSSAVFHWLEVSFPTPPSNLKTGAGLQKFQIYVKRQGTNADNINVNLRLEENTVDKGSIGNNNCTSSTGEILEYTWDASLLSNVDGSGVEFRLQTNSLGSPIDVIDVGGITWVYVTEPTLGISLNGG